MRACIYDENGKEVEGFYVFEVEAQSPSRVIGAPIESGQTSFDNKVIDPKKVVVKGTIVIDSNGEYSNTLSKIASMIDNRNFEFYKVCDGTDIYEHLVLQTKSVNRNVDKFDFANVTLQYVEAMLVQKVYSKKPSNSENTDTRSNGYLDGLSADLPTNFALVVGGVIQ